MNLTQVQLNARVLSERHGWDAEALKTRLDYLKDEMNEVLDEVNFLVKASTDEEREYIKKRLGHEMFDVIWNLAELANRFEIDLSEACQEKMAINENRKFSDKPKQGGITFD
jgi:NTP pyrophosphatase (non-canonical NTP hydrolase)